MLVGEGGVRVCMTNNDEGCITEALERALYSTWQNWLDFFDLMSGSNLL